ncbi:MAG: phosphoenolpyruvate protein kinase [Methanomassiliicoccales archaeon]|nr:MAG: phosphoenolpyruvate protein kinase [Methanomassiliicoccales archaeon]
MVGGKASNLANLMSAGFPVPPGVVVGVTEYEQFLDENGLRHRISSVLSSTDLHDVRDVERASKEIRSMIMSAPLGIGLVEGLRTVLGGDDGSLWAVRSSAIAEDLADASFAGQQDTYLCVRGEEVPSFVKSCWASYWNDRAISYRYDNDVPQLGNGIAVVVQKMVSAISSGIMFTKDPLNGDDKVIIESSWGLGESIASGIVSPDRFVCDGHGKLRDRHISKKLKAFYLSPSGSREVVVEESAQSKPSINDGQIEMLAELGLRLEAHFGSPQDIEWAFDGERLFILQSRPITTLTTDNTLWTRAYGDEYWADVTSPLFFSLLGEYLTKYVNHEGSEIMGYKELTEKKLLRVHKGHIYFNSEVLEEVFTYNPKFSRTKELLNYFPIKDQERIAKAKTKIAKRLLAEVRIAILDPDGVILRTNKAYDRWAKRFMESVREFDSKDLRSMTPQQLHEEFKRLENDYLKHFRLIRYGMVTHSIGMNLMVKRWLTDWLDDESGVLYSKVISGLKGNKTIETNIALSKLADKARDDAYVLAGLSGLSSSDFLHKMRTDERMVAFRAEFEGFLRSYGQRSHTREIYFPRWRDDQTLVVDILRALVRSSRLDLEKVEVQKIEERKKAEKEILDRIGKMRFGPFRKIVFRTVLSYAQTYLMFRENQRFYLDHILDVWRRLFMEYGRRFAEEGMIEAPEDIFFLSKEEIFDLAEKNGGSVRKTVASRKKEFDRYKDRLPPKFLRGNVEFDDTVIWQGNVMKITGTSASPGTFTGTARVVGSIEDLPEVMENEILITSNTDPGWTAVFSKIGGLITETGGILSHGAVVSREYGIPAVTAVKGATKIFKTGQRITLDGNEGAIYIMEG